MMNNLNVSILSKYFPQDTLWRNGVAEWVGYSPSKNQFIVIEDGCCRSEDGEWMVHIYEPNIPLTKFSEILENKYWPSELAKKIKEEWVKFY